MWQIFAFLNALSMGIGNLFVKVLGGRLNPFLGALLIQGVNFFFVLLFFLLMGGSFSGAKESIALIFLAGLMGAIGLIAWFKMFALGAPLVIGGTLAIMGVIIFTALGGIIFLGEKLTLPVFIGFILALLSAYLLTLR